MCLTHSAGPGGRNLAADVKSLQLLLNLNSGVRGFDARLVADGRWGPMSQAALERFRRAAGVLASGPVAPADATLKALRAGLPQGLAKEQLAAVMIDAPAERIDRFHPPLLAVLRRYGIDTPRRIAHFLAQLGHESASLRYTEEIASGAAYEGRKDLGNLHPGDGQRFKGRGLIQLTGRANYREYGQHCGRDFEHADDPALVASDPALAVDVAGWYWWRRKLDAWADRDDLREVTRRVNGGFNGLQDRARYLARGRWLLPEEGERAALAG